MTALVIFMIRGYRACISPFLPAACRFYPTCSTYAEQAIERHGWSKGIKLSLRRVFRCHPLGPHGYDPVP